MFNNLQLYGRCRTYVLAKDVVSWNKTNSIPMTYNYPIGSKGVIMSQAFPDVNPNNSSSYNNYLIQKPDPNGPENIIVVYEVASIAKNVEVNLYEHIKAETTTLKVFTSADMNTTFTSVSTYQQYLNYTIPKNSEGILLRFTVLSSTGTLQYLTTVLISIVVYLFHA